MVEKSQGHIYLEKSGLSNLPTPVMDTWFGHLYDVKEISLLEKHKSNRVLLTEVHVNTLTDSI